MKTIPADLLTFLNENRDSREYRRALAVKLVQQGLPYATICTLLDVTPGFVSQAKTAYETYGVKGLRSKIPGVRSLLNREQRREVIRWIKTEQIHSIEHLRTHIETTYAVVYQSKQSYYRLLAEAGITYKRSQEHRLKHDADTKSG